MPPPFQWISRIGDGHFEILDLIRVQIFGDFWWHTEELDSAEAKGAIFRAYEGSEEEPSEQGYVLVADISDDPDEPSVQDISEETLPNLDAYLRTELTKKLEADGMEILSWQGSVLNSVNHWEQPHLVTAYTGFDPICGERIYMDGRREAFGSKIGVSTAFNKDLSEDQTGGLISSWLSTSLCSQVH